MDSFVIHPAQYGIACGDNQLQSGTFRTLPFVVDSFFFEHLRDIELLGKFQVACWANQPEQIFKLPDGLLGQTDRTVIGQ